MYLHYEHSKVFKVWCILLVITVFILGIIAGFVFKVQYRYSREHFNWGLSIIIWISAVFPIAILYAVYSHLENQEIQINNLNEIREMLNDQKVSNNEKTNLSSSQTNFNKIDKTWVCTKCGKSNPAGIDRCSSCDFRR